MILEVVVDLNSSSVGILERGIENVDGDNDVGDDDDDDDDGLTWQEGW